MYHNLVLVLWHSVSTEIHTARVLSVCSGTVSLSNNFSRQFFTFGRACAMWLEQPSHGGVARIGYGGLDTVVWSQWEVVAGAGAVYNGVGDMNWSNYRRMSARRLRTLQTKWMDKMNRQNR